MFRPFFEIVKHFLECLDFFKMFRLKTDLLDLKIAWIHNRCAIGDAFGRFWGPFSTSKKKHCFENCFASF